LGRINHSIFDEFKTRRANCSSMSIPNEFNDVKVVPVSLEELHNDSSDSEPIKESKENEDQKRSTINVKRKRSWGNSILSLTEPMLSMLSTKTIELKQDWDSYGKHEKPSWFELFTDLLFVGVIIKLANQFKHAWLYSENGNKMIVCFEIWLIFTGFGILWIELMTLFSRFHIISVFSSTLHYLYLIGILISAMSIQENKPILSLRKAWSFGFAISLISLALLHVIIRQSNARAFHYANLRILVFGLSGILTLISIFLNTMTATWMFIIIYSVILFQSANSFRVDESRLPVNVQHFTERLGLLVMIMLGESILAIILPPFETDNGHIILTLLSFTLIYSIRCSYFFDVSVGMLDHALRNDSLCGSSCFVMIHLPLAFSLLLLSCSLKIIFYKFSKDHLKVGTDQAFLLTISISIVYVFILSLRLSHPIDHDFKTLVLRMIIALIYPILPYCIENSIELVAVCAMLCSLGCCLDRIIQSNLSIHEGLRSSIVFKFETQMSQTSSDLDMDVAELNAFRNSTYARSSCGDLEQQGTFVLSKSSAHFFHAGERCI